MIIKIKTSADVPSSEITPEQVYKSRRQFMRATAAGAVGAVAGTLLGHDGFRLAAAQALPAAKKSAFTTDPSVDPLSLEIETRRLPQRPRPAPRQPGPPVDLARWVAARAALAHHERP